MQEPHREDSASHPDPESCARGGNGTGEALTGAHAGQPLSCEIRQSGAPTSLTEAEGHTGGSVIGKLPSGPAQSKTLRMRGNSLHGTREIPPASAPDGGADRSAKAAGRNADVHAGGKSDGRTVPMKQANKAVAHRPTRRGAAAAEPVEGRRPARGNALSSTASRTQRREDASPGLQRVREVARRDRCARFTCLLHHVTVALLRDSFLALQRQAAPGIDGVTWTQYEVGLEDRLTDLHHRVHQGTYRAQPSRRTYIPKADGKQRPIGVAALEDKVVQHALTTVLSAVYEQDFRGFSYGSRPGRSQHDALDALWVAITMKKVNWVLDADIRGFYDTIDHGWMRRFLQHRMADRRVLRLLDKWLRAGVSEEGRWSPTTVGTPQGAVISPLLANVYLHYVFDLWVEHWRRHSAHGAVIVVRYADDSVVGFEHRDDAEQFLALLGQRLRQFGLALHPDKTRLIEFGRYAAERRRRRGERKPETFDFLGMTHIGGRQWLGTGFLLRRKSIAQRLRAKLQVVKRALMQQRHWPIPVQGAWLRSVVQGYFNYHAVPGNIAALETFRTEAVRHWRRALKRRSQRSRMAWTRFGSIANRWIPHPKILHPFPGARFDANHPRQEPSAVVPLAGI